MNYDFDWDLDVARAFEQANLLYECGKINEAKVVARSIYEHSHSDPYYIMEHPERAKLDCEAYDLFQKCLGEAGRQDQYERIVVISDIYNPLYRLMNAGKAFHPYMMECVFPCEVKAVPPDSFLFFRTYEKVVELNKSLNKPAVALIIQVGFWDLAYGIQHLPLRYNVPKNLIIPKMLNYFEVTLNSILALNIPIIIQSLPTAATLDLLTNSSAFYVKMDTEYQSYDALVAEYNSHLSIIAEHYQCHWMDIPVWNTESGTSQSFYNQLVSSWTQYLGRILTSSSAYTTRHQRLSYELDPYQQKIH